MPLKEGMLCGIIKIGKMAHSDEGRALFKSNEKLEAIHV